VDAYDQGDTQKLATGQLLTADNEIDTTTGTAKLKAVFNNENESLFPNQFVNIHLVMENRPNALVVPSAAIQSGVQGSFVWAVKTDGTSAPTAQMQPVKVALAQGQLTILDSGVTAGTKVVVDGADRLRQGGQVTVSQAKQAGGGQGAGPGSGANQGQNSGNAGANANGQGNGQHHKKEQQ
jgi:multidrug efflux system membrane fusion protein